MYGLNGKFTAQAGKRDELLGLLIQAAEGLRDYDGCLLYVVSTDPTAPDDIWIYEAWRSKAHHDASLTLESTQALISRARPLIAGMGGGMEFEPVGGKGLPSDS